MDYYYWGLLFAILDPSSSPGGKVDNDVTNLLWQRLGTHAIFFPQNTFGNDLAAFFNTYHIYHFMT